MTGSTLTLSPKPNSGARQADVRVLDGGCQGLPVGGPQGAALQGDRGRSGGGEEGHVRYTRVWYGKRGEEKIGLKALRGFIGACVGCVVSLDADVGHGRAGRYFTLKYTVVT